MKTGTEGAVAVPAVFDDALSNLVNVIAQTIKGHVAQALTQALEGNRLAPSVAAPKQRGRPPKNAQLHAADANKPKCTEKGCTRPSRAKGLCTSHYQKHLREQKAATAAPKANKEKKARKSRKKTGTPAPSPTAT